MKKVSKKVLSAVMSILLIVTLLPVTAFAANSSFKDVPKNAWYAEAVDYVESQGLMMGTSSTTFSPNSATTRGMIVSILYRMAGSPNLESPVGYPYADVNSKAYYANAVYWARQQGIVAGYSASKFGPNDPITREQMARILCQYSKYAGRDVSGRANLYVFKDGGKVSNWAWDAMRWAVADKVFSGDTRGYLQPQGKATRAQVASVLMRYQLQGNVPEKPPVDPEPTVLPGSYPKTFSFASGAGGWATELTLHADGTFKGRYYDFDYGLTEVYPNGVCSYNDFHGTFGNIQKRDAHSYTMVLKDLHNDSRGNYIENGVGYEEVALPYGFTNDQGSGLVQTYRFYLPTAPTAQLGSDFLLWWPGRYGEQPPATLGFYAIENAETHNGFFGK